MTSGIGVKKCTYRCKLSNVNNLKMKLQVSVRDSNDKMVAFANAQNTPIILVSRTDIEDSDLSEKDSSTGLIQRNGKWEY